MLSAYIILTHQKISTHINGFLLDIRQSSLELALPPVPAFWGFKPLQRNWWQALDSLRLRYGRLHRRKDPRLLRMFRRGVSSPTPDLEVQVQWQQRILLASGCIWFVEHSRLGVWAESWENEEKRGVPSRDSDTRQDHDWHLWNTFKY